MIKAKSGLRNSARLRRSELARGNAGFAAAIARFAGSLAIAAGAIVAGYWPMGDEADPRELMAALAARGHRLALPRIDAPSAPLAFHRWQVGDVLVAHRFGMAEPHRDAPVVVPDAVLVPLLAFDATGHRLGYGGGFYDRTLDGLRGARTIGVAYAGQEVEALPHEAHDRALDAIVTENGVREFTR